MFVVEDRVLFAGDLMFAGRVPFVGTADSRGWLAAMDKMIAVNARGRHSRATGRASTDVARDLATTRDYLAYLRGADGRAVKDFEPFDDAYAKDRLVALLAGCRRSPRPTASTPTEPTCGWSRKSSTTPKTSQDSAIDSSASLCQ